MPAYNKVILIGNLTRDPEMRVTPKGTAICQLGIAVNRKFKKEDGSQAEEVTFVDLEAWGKTAELIAKYLTKGAPAMFEGRLKLDQWDDKTTGKKMSKLKVVIESVQFLGSKGDAPAAAPAAATTAPAAPAAAPGIDEDVPF
jgi:single-strand DNA-binding protein